MIDTFRISDVPEDLKLLEWQMHVLIDGVLLRGMSRPYRGPQIQTCGFCLQHHMHRV